MKQERFNQDMTSSIAPGITVDLALQIATQYLQQENIETPRLDARLLLQAALAMDHADIISNGGRMLNEEEAANFKHFIQRRSGHEPVHRIIGKSRFWGLELKVGQAVLEPRADTERLIEAVLEWIDAHGSQTNQWHIADIGTGSGAIIIALLYELKNATAVAVDISAQALDIARTNAHNYQLDKRIHFTRGSYCQPLTGKFDLIVSNPPYIPTKAIEGLAPEVRKFDPLIALDGGGDGLNAYRRLLDDSAGFLNKNGMVFFEIGHDQANDVTHLARVAGWRNIKIWRDLPGNDRIFSASR
jgi:release factor glutamine methyltransferase